MTFLLTLLTMLSILPEDFSFQLSYGVYVNNHYERKFIAKERIWKLKNKQLTYLLDAHNVRYSDTIILSPDSLKRLESFIKDAQFPSSISKNIEKKYAAKFGYSKSIRGFIQFKDQKVEIQLKTNSPDGFEENSMTKKLLDLEQQLHKLTDQ